MSTLTSTVPALNYTSELSTTDSGPSPECVTDGGSVPWFLSNCCRTCPTFQGPYFTDAPHPIVNSTILERDIFGRLPADVCGGVEVELAQGRVYAVLSSMELWLR